VSHMCTQSVSCMLHDVFGTMRAVRCMLTVCMYVDNVVSYAIFA